MKHYFRVFFKSIIIALRFYIKNCKAWYLSNMLTSRNLNTNRYQLDELY